jgi:hypothetical protein
MFNFNNTEIPTALDKRISELLEELDALTGDTEEYTTAATNLAKLMDLRNDALKVQNEKAKVETEKDRVEIDKEKLNIEHTKLAIDHDKVKLDVEKFEADQELRRSWKPSPDAVIGAAASVAGILLVLHYEKIGVITSKALGFVGKMTK